MNYKEIIINIFVVPIYLLFVKVMNLLKDDPVYTLKATVICSVGISCIHSACSYFSPGDRIANNAVNTLCVFYVVYYFLLLAAKKIRKNSQQNSYSYYTNIFQFVQQFDDWNKYLEHHNMIDQDDE